MSKAAVLGATGAAGAGGTGLYVAHSLGVFGISGDEQERRQAERQLDDDVSKFKKSNGRSCLKDLFSPWSEENLINLSQEPTSVTKEEVKLGDKAGSNKTQSCLVVNWDKIPAEENSKPWTGNFRLLWSLVRGKKGFAVYFTAKTDSTDTTAKKMTADGVAYIFEEDGGKWKAKQKLDIKQDKKSLSTEIKEKFPQRGDSIDLGIQVKEETKKFWGFLKNEGDLDSTAPIYFRERWFWKNDDANGKTNGEWSSNLGTWWEHFFGKDVWDMEELVKEVKGKWEIKNYIGHYTLS